MSRPKGNTIVWQDKVLDLLGQAQVLLQEYRSTVRTKDRVGRTAFMAETLELLHRASIRLCRLDFK